MDSLLDRRDLPIFIHNVIDDMTDLTPNAMRVYMHLARRADKGGRAWPSYQSIGDHCFSSVSDNAVTRKSFARRAIDELIAAGLLLKEERVREDGGQTSNGYMLTNPTRGSTPVLNDIPVPIDTPMPISTPVSIKHPPVLNEHDPCLLSTNNTPIENTPIKPKGDEDDPHAHARDAIHEAWFDYYGEELPSNLEKPMASLKNETSDDAVVYGIRCSVEAKSRNFRYIATCARNYLPSKSSNGQSAYHVDIPGIVPMSAAPVPTPPPLPPPPMPADDPWAIALAELTPVLPGNSAKWLEGSRLVANGELAGVPLYRVELFTDAANIGWLKQQAEPAIRKKVSSIVGKRILVDFAVVDTVDSIKGN